MVRRRLTLKRLDPWSVLKFGFVANLVLLVLFLLVALVVWFIIDRLALIDQACDIALDVGFTQCGVNVGNLFRALVLLGLLWVVVQTAVLVFLSFLHNLLADLTGGLAVTVHDSTPGGAERQESGRQPATARSRPGATVSGAGAAAGSGGESGQGRFGTSAPAASGSSPGRAPSGGSGGTSRPPVPPLRRDSSSAPRESGADSATREHPPTERRREPRSDDSGEIMFGDRGDRGDGGPAGR